jgi:ABC-type antimicrobial peptide transport system permease subunit
MATGMIFATFVGATGGLFPARNAAKKEILGALREI